MNDANDKLRITFETFKLCTFDSLFIRKEMK